MDITFSELVTLVISSDLFGSYFGTLVALLCWQCLVGFDRPKWRI